jgi:hypothetical protein
MDPAQRKRFVERSLKDMREREGDQPPDAELDANARKIIDQGFKSFYSEASAETKMDVAPLIEQLQKNLQGCGDAELQRNLPLGFFGAVSAGVGSFGWAGVHREPKARPALWKNWENRISRIHLHHSGKVLASLWRTRGAVGTDSEDRAFLNRTVGPCRGARSS